MRNPRKQALHDAIKSFFFVVAILIATGIGMCSSPSVVDGADAVQVGTAKTAAGVALSAVQVDSTEEMKILRKSATEIRKARQRAKARKEYYRLMRIREGSKKAGRWLGTHKEWDKLARLTMKRKGLSKSERKMMMSIHHGEGGPNSINPSGKFYGGWQLKKSIAMKIDWWDPVDSTKRAIKYVNGHVYQGYGSGIEAAYLHKKARDWY